MKKQIFALLLLVAALTGCNRSPTELPLLKSFIPADSFARGYIDHILKGEADSCFAEADPSFLTDKTKENITNACHSLKGATLKKYHILEEIATEDLAEKDHSTVYKLSYEYELINSYVVFVTVVNKKDGKFSMASFRGNINPAPLSELNKFTLAGKSAAAYIFQQDESK